MSAMTAADPDLDRRLAALTPEQRRLLELRRKQKEGADPSRPRALPRRDGEELPLSFGQERLWFLDRLDPGSAAYNIPVHLRLEGDLDVAALRATLDEVIRRHEALRTTFAETAGGPVQVIAPTLALSLPVVDLRGLPPELREAEAGRWSAAEAARPFDLARGPLLRMLLLRLADAGWSAAFSFHHIVGDGWSIEVLIREIAALYPALRAGGPSPLPPLLLQYADFAAWQRGFLAGPVLAAQLDYWRRQLAGAPAVSQLPGDRPRPAVQRFHGGSVRHPLPEASVAALRRLCQSEGTTLFMGLLAAFAALLSRCSGAADLTVGTPVAGRNRGELEGLIGLFINSLVMRLRLEGDPGFAELLAQARTVALGAYAHQDLPFAKLVAELAPERNLGLTPLFQVQLVLVEADYAQLELPGLTLIPVALEESTSKLDLTLRAYARPQGMELVWLYNTDLFDAASVRRLGDRFAALLAAAVASPDLPLSALPLLSRGEEHQLLAEWNDTTVEGWLAPEPATLHELIAAPAARTPDRIAVTCEGESLSYAELLGAARRLGRRLQELGVGPDVAVGVFAERSLEMVVGLLAILEAGGAYLPLDPAYPADRLAYMVADAAAPVILVQERLRDKLPPHAAVIVSLDGTAVAAKPEPPLPASAGADNLAYVIYTSGSTGRPKGTMNSHRSIVNRLLWMQARYGLTPDDRVLQKTPFSFDVSVWEFFWPLLAGARLVMAIPGGHQDPAYLAAAIATEGITTIHFVPSLLRVFVEAPGIEACTSLRQVMASGEALPLDLVRRFHQRLSAGLHNLYGPTEAAVDVTYWACEREEGRGLVPIGRPVANTRILILDREGRPAPLGVPGELHIGGLQLARGYLGRPDLTAERFVPDPLAGIWGEPGGRLYRTGDLARTLPDGAVEFLGRIDHQVKLRGLRIELGEIEAALGELPGVKAAVVMARGDGGGETRLVAYVVSKPTAEPAPELAGIRETLGRSLPEYMLPAALVVLPAMPLTPSGKVDRKALPVPEIQRVPAAEAVAPRTPLETWLAGLFGEILKLDSVGVHDDFFALGGTSISGAVLINRLQRELGEIVHVVVIFDHPTVARLAVHLAAQHAGAVGGQETPAEHAEEVDEAMLARFRTLIHEPPPLPGALAGEPRNPPAVFVLAPPRSGSTLLRVMLGGHPALFAPPELELLEFDSLAERREAFPGRDAFRLEGAIRAVMEARGCGPEPAREMVAGLEEQGTTVRGFYRRLQEWIGDRTLVDKTPTYAWSLETLRRAEASFEGARYVHLLRHPYATIASFEEARIEQVFFPRAEGFTRRQLAEMSWLLAQRNILRFLAAIPAERRHIVRFEELVAEPGRVLRELCDFLGLDYHPDMALPYKDRSARMTDGLHAESRMLGDVKFHQHSGVDAKAAERWRELAAESFLGSGTRRLAAELGYAPEPDRQAWTAIPRAAGDGPLPLSFAQERMWFLHELDPHSSAYVISGAIRLRGALDAGVLELCFAELVRRHETLRTTFAPTREWPVQIVRAPSGVALPLIDLAALPAEAREAEARSVAAAEESRPFDLVRGPVCRFTLLRLAEGEHVLMLALHHICSDGWSMVVLVRELGALYRAFLAGEPSPLPALPIQYGDFAAWQRATLQGEALAAELDWWRRRLAGGPPPLRLPADRRRSAVAGFQIAGVEAEIPAAVVRGLQALSRRGSASLYITLLAAWKGLLARLTGERDVVVGAPTANRTRPEVEGLIGFFLNTLALRTDISGDPSFLDLLGRVRETALGAFAHQDMPLQTILRAVSPGAAAKDPFQVMFLLQNLPPQEASVAGLTFSALEADRILQDLDSTGLEAGLTLYERPEGLAAAITYNGFLFDRSTGLRLLERYGRLLEAVAADPGRPLSCYELMSAPERAELLAWGAPPPAAAARFVPVHRAFAERSAMAPEAVAVIAGERRLTYGELDRRSNQVARRLRTLGVGPERAVGVAVERSPELLVALFGVLKAGGVCVPLDPSYPPERLSFIREDAGVEVVLDAAMVAETGESGETGESEEIEEIGIGADHLAYLIYTSGSTGRPKGVMVRHGSLANYVAAFRDEHGLGPADRVLQFSALSFDTSAEEIYPCLTSGATLVLRDDSVLGTPAGFLGACGEQGITVLDLPTAFWHGLVAGLEAEPAALPPGLRLVIVGGERALPERVAAWHALGCEAVLVNTYGPTETTIVATRCALEPGVPIAGEVPIGRPVPGASARVMDPELELTPTGAGGELWVGGVGVARGYRGRADLTAERFVPDPWSAEPGARAYRTGDVVRWLSSGELEFLGRADDQVKIRGFRVELREVEAALLEHPRVAAAVVVPRERGAGDRRLEAFVVPRGDAPEPAGLRAFLRERLPDYMVPAVFATLEALPLTPSGKVDRRALPAAGSNAGPGVGLDEGKGFVAPRTTAEETVAAIWREVLGLARAGATDHFFELGGHSLLLPQVLHRLRAAFQVAVPLRLLFDEPTLEGLALAVEEIVLEEIERQMEEGQTEERGLQ